MVSPSSGDTQLGGIGYWWLLVIGPNFIYIRVMKYKNRKKFPYTGNGYLVPNTSLIEFDSIGVPFFTRRYKSLYPAF